jgi:uncharacterized protein YfiM (DUF2279 family)
MKLLFYRLGNIKSAALASHSCTVVPLRGFLAAVLILLFALPVAAQDSTKAQTANINIQPLPDTNIQHPASSHAYGPPEWRSRAGLVSAKGLHIPYPAPSTYPYNKKRVRLVTIGNIVGYGATLVGFYSAWYKQYPQTNFHSFNDSREWLQVDKLGHVYGAYIGGYGSMEMWRWTGLPRKKRIWIGGLSGVAYQTIIETLDGFSKGWGWSWSDVTANIVGSGLLIGQELAWDEQRIKIKFSFHQRNYGDADLNRRANNLFGKSPSERFIKDYNAQTYWASVNLRSFFPKSRLPRWLNVAVGYGAEGLFGAEANVGKDDNGNVVFNRPDIKRYRQWFIAPDIDLTKIPTKKKGVRLLLGVLNAFKFPAPSLELSNGKVRVNGFHF